MAYDPISGKCLVGTTQSEGDDIYSIDFSTRELALLNDNATLNLNGMGGATHDGSNFIFSSINDNFNLFLVSYNSAGELVNNMTISGFTIENGASLVTGGQTGKVYRGTRGGFDVIDLSTGSTTDFIAFTTSDLVPFTAEDSGFDLSNNIMMNLAEDNDGNVYGTLIDSEQFLVSVNLETGELTYIATNPLEQRNLITGLVFVPAYLFD